MTWAYSYVPDDSIAPNGLPGGAGIVQFGRFTGNYPGRYTLMASAGGASAQKTIQVTPRDVRQRITVTSRGNINSTHTSDLWPWTGKDGRDYCLVGTSGDTVTSLIVRASIFTESVLKMLFMSVMSNTMPQPSPPHVPT